MQASKSRLAVPIIVLALAFIAAACGSDDGASEPSTSSVAPPTTGAAGPTDGPGSPAPQPLPERTKVTVAMSNRFEVFSGILLADEMGEFDKENIDLEIAQLPTNDGVLQLINGGVLMQIAGVSASQFNAVNTGAEIRAMANTHYQTDASKEGLYVRNDLMGPDGLVDPDKIPGMRIAIGSAGVSNVAAVPVITWLEDNGYTFDDVESIPLGGPDLVVALEQGSLDAGYVQSPLWQDPTVTECCTLVTPQPPLAAGVYNVSADALENDRPVVTAVMRAIMRTVRTYLQGDYHADPEVVAALSEILQIPEDVIVSTPALYFDPDLPLQVEVLQEAQQIWLDAGVLEYGEPLPASRYADVSVIDELLKEG